MSSAPLEEALRDPARLEALRRTALLDSPAEESFDRLSRLTCRLLDAPVALVSLVGSDRQFFKSCVGLPEPWASQRETPLSHSFCQHVVGSGQPLVVEDARTDERLRGNLAIEDLEVIAYLGVPLRLSSGEVMGSFCVIDHRPRAWTAQDIATLEDLSLGVGAEIELRLEVALRRETEAERQQLIESLEAERSRLVSIFMEAPAVIALYRGPEHVIEAANPLFLRTVGYRDVIGKPIREAFPELDGQGFFEQMDGVYRTGQPFVGNEVHARWRADTRGTPAEGYFNYVYQPLYASDGSVEGILVHAVDVTEQVVARQQVEKLATERDAILRQIADGVIVTDAAGTISFANEAARRIHGRRVLGVGVEQYTEQYQLLRTTGEPYPPEELPLARAVLRGETVVDAEWKILRPDGVEVVAQGSAAPVLDDAETMLGAVLTLRDITEQRALERQRAELLDARDRAQERLSAALDARRRFLASISHELRTPLNAILGYNDLVLAGIYGSLNGAQEEAVEKSQRAARHLLELVNDVLDLSKLEAGKLELVLESVPVDSLIDEILSTVRPLAADRETELVWTRRAPGVPLETDPRRVRQILLNLFSNAIKFGRGRPVEVGVEVDEGAQRLQIWVADSGVGVAPEDLERIFDEFVQLDQGHGGTGLGLPISKRLARLLGGSLEAESRPGEGSTFRLRLPLHPESAAPAEDAGR